jgi:molybdopterin synthase catalytic subunit
LNELNDSFESGVDLMIQNSGVHEKGTFNLSDLINNAKRNEEFAKAGAIAIFIGVVRGETLEGKKVVNLKMEAYEEKANEVLTKISKELSKKPGIVDVEIHHLLGEFSVGEDVVYVSVTGSHREEVFSVLREAVERYKKEAPVFKKEKIADAKGTESEYWVSEIRTHEN